MPFDRRPPFRSNRMIDLSHLGLTCANCSKPILALPFEPRLDRPLYCNDCHAKRRLERGDSPA